MKTKVKKESKTKEKKQGFLELNYSMFINSFRKIKLWILAIIALDIAFYFILMQAGTLFLGMLQQKASGITLDSALLANPAGIEALSSTIRGFFIFLIASIIILIVFIAALSGILKGIIWTISAGKKPAFVFMKKFLLLSMIWIPSWLILVFLLAIGIKQDTAPLFILALVPFYLHFTNVLYILFLEESRIGMIKKAFSMGIRKILYYLIPYAAIALLFYAISSVYNIISLKTGINPNVYLVIVVCFVAWVRYYLISIAMAVLKGHAHQKP